MIICVKNTFHDSSDLAVAALYSITVSYYRYHFKRFSIRITSKGIL